MRILPALLFLGVSAAAPALATNDPLFAEQTNLHAVGIDAVGAWAVTRGHGAVICVLDDGIDYLHEEVRNRIALNPTEFPAWITAGADGVLGLEDFDAATTDIAGNTFVLDPALLTVADLLLHFRNGIDDDGDGFVDNLAGWDFDDDDDDAYDLWQNGHGSGRAGILVAEADNGVGLAGIAPEARLLPVRVGDSILHTNDTLARAAVYCADHGADSINMSLGATGRSAFLEAAFRYARDRGVVSAAASGNESHYHHEFPAVIDSVYAVGSVIEAASREGMYTEKNNTTDYGAHLMFAAPTDTWTMRPFEDRTGTRREGGTSSATPHLAATAALVHAAARRHGTPLGADEVFQVLRMTATDIRGTKWGAVPGWDPFTGYGRIDAAAAVRAVVEGKIPPVADLEFPAWFHVVDPVRTPTLTLRGRVAGRNGHALAWRAEWGSGIPPATWNRIADGRSATALDGDLPGAVVETAKLLPPPQVDPLSEIGNPQSHSITVRLVVTDQTTGLEGEDRLTFFVHRDPDTRPGFPLDFDSSFEGSLLAVDLDGDGKDEIVAADSAGIVRALNGDGSVRWSYALPAFDGAGLPAELRDLPRGMPILGAPAAGDLDGDGRTEVVVPGLLGEVHALRADGTAFWTAPARTGLSRYPGEEKTRARLYGPAVLADLDDDGTLEVIAGAQDQQLYVWNADGRPRPGFPVHLSDEWTQDDAASGAERPKPAASAPAVGDVNGDGQVDIVIGTNEIRRGVIGYLYAVDGRGNAAPGGPFVGNRAMPTIVAPFGLPILGEGISGGVTVVDLDGDGALEIIAGGFGGIGAIWSGTSDVRLLARNQAEFARGNNTDEPLLAGWTNSLASVGDIDGDGVPEIFAAGMGLGELVANTLAEKMADGRVPEVDHLVTGWSADGKFLPYYPRRIEGWAMVTNPLIGDVDGDGRPEVIAGSSGYYVHAYRADGKDSAGWPKFTGSWLIATPVLADLDGDGRATLVQATRNGQIFAWQTKGRMADAQWPQYARTAARDGAHGMTFAPRAAPPTVRAGCRSATAEMPALLLLLALSAVRILGKRASRRA